MSKSNGVDTDWARSPPPAGPLWMRICKAIYDPEEKSFLGRTPKRWGILFVFYAVFYAVLAAMFAACMGGLFMTLDEKKPVFILDSSLIGSNPGVAFRPRVDGVVRLDATNSTSYEEYVNNIRDFIAGYESNVWFNSKKGCDADDNYGYPDSPCFFIKLNKIYGWKPEYLDTKNLPSDMSSDLIEYIATLQDLEHQQIWVSCWDPSSNETRIEYPWGRGLPGRFYPYLNDDGYLSPFLAIKIKPQVNRLSSVRCRAWAKNIRYNKSLKEPSGFTLIQIFVEDNTALNNTETLAESK
ncbi:sodium/potassium-transporting ATPase subunit beta-1-like [Leptidea sinapis]|uniref:sodium/potassium-transporting ATPase subunit beta-1-like n=1 Tax=Leptidea sinapis TaxID=189913 RepID=UPI002121CACE|nr:sodium/potassium-transporting ATPase subunit beta-1-like [Leptidea sinapis]